MIEIHLSFSNPHENGSRIVPLGLGKEFSAKGIQESCAMNILALERKHLKSNSTASENIQNPELREYVKENLADIMLRGEKVIDYVSKKFKQKKKKRLFKGI